MQVGADLLIFDQKQLRNVTPGQSRAIAERTELKVIDRTGACASRVTMLILDIFAQHAHSRPCMDDHIEAVERIPRRPRRWATCRA